MLAVKTTRIDYCDHGVDHDTSWEQYGIHPATRAPMNELKNLDDWRIIIIAPASVQVPMNMTQPHLAKSTNPRRIRGWFSLENKGFPCCKDLKTSQMLRVNKIDLELHVWQT